MLSLYSIIVLVNLTKNSPLYIPNFDYRFRDSRPYVYILGLINLVFILIKILSVLYYIVLLFIEIISKDFFLFLDKDFIRISYMSYVVHSMTILCF